MRGSSGTSDTEPTTIEPVVLTALFLGFFRLVGVLRRITSHLQW
jgi:hypothetical protein